MKIGDQVALADFGPGCIVPDGLHTVSKINPDGSFHVGGRTAVWPERLRPMTRWQERKDGGDA